jgi:hypothetical protein
MNSLLAAYVGTPQQREAIAEFLFSRSGLIFMIVVIIVVACTLPKPKK